MRSSILMTRPVRSSCTPLELLLGCFTTTTLQFTQRISPNLSECFSYYTYQYQMCPPSVMGEQIWKKSITQWQNSNQLHFIWLCYIQQILYLGQKTFHKGLWRYLCGKMDNWFHKPPVFSKPFVTLWCILNVTIWCQIYYTSAGILSCMFFKFCRIVHMWFLSFPASSCSPLPGALHLDKVDVESLQSLEYRAWSTEIEEIVIKKQDSRNDALNWKMSRRST